MDERAVKTTYNFICIASSLDSFARVHQRNLYVQFS